MRGNGDVDVLYPHWVQVPTWLQQPLFQGYFFFIFENFHNFSIFAQTNFIHKVDDIEAEVLTETGLTEKVQKRRVKKSDKVNFAFHFEF